MKNKSVTLIRASVLAAFIALSAAPASADTFTFMSGLFGGFNRPNEGAPPTSLSGFIVPLNAQMFEVSLSGPYSFTISGASFIVLYENSFDFQAPLINALIAVNGNFTFDLTAGTTYIFVPTIFSGTTISGFVGTISGPGEITPVGGVVIPEPATILLLCTGLAGVAVRLRRRSKN